MKTILVEEKVVSVVDGEAQWTIHAGQVEKHRPMFGADFDAAPKAQRDKLAALVAADALAVKAGA